MPPDIQERPITGLISSRRRLRGSGLCALSLSPLLTVTMLLRFGDEVARTPKEAAA